MNRLGYTRHGDRVPMPLLDDNIPNCHHMCPHWEDDGGIAVCAIDNAAVEYGLCLPSIRAAMWAAKEIRQVLTDAYDQGEIPCPRYVNSKRGFFVITWMMAPIRAYSRWRKRMGSCSSALSVSPPMTTIVSESTASSAGSKEGCQTTSSQNQEDGPQREQE